MRHLSLLIVSLMLTGCCLLKPQETLPSKQPVVPPQTSLAIDCVVPPDIPKQGSSYRELESWGIRTLQIWADCAKDKKALVDSWPKGN